ncbi:unnamed protein product [Closterium sp. NIES-65]|nr:unnamed protein product [Closterium sp. NIES-65]
MLFHSRFIPHPLTASLLQRRGITRALEGDLAAAARSGASRDARADDAVCAQAANERVGARGEAMGDARGNESAGATCGDIDRREINPFGSSWSGENRNRVSVSISQFGDRVSVNPAGDSASHASMRPINAATMTPDGGAADGAASIDGRCDPRGDVLTMAPDGGAAEGVATRPVDASTMAAEGAASIDGRCDSRDDDGAGWRRDGEAAKRANSLSVALRNAATVEVSAGRQPARRFAASQTTARVTAMGRVCRLPLPPPPTSRASAMRVSSLSTGAIVGIVLGCFAGFTLRAAVVAWLLWPRGPKKWEGLDVCEQFTLQQMLSATNNWSEENVLGKGGFGIVYKGRSPQGQLWAIKRSTIMTNDFETEVRAMGSLHHTHLVRLLGFCLDQNVETGKQEQILVYEFMANRDLQYHIHRTKPMKLVEAYEVDELRDSTMPAASEEAIVDFADLALDCIKSPGTRRPTMKDVAYRLSAFIAKHCPDREDEWESVAKEESEGNKGMSSRDVSSTSLEDSGRESGRSQGSQSCASSFMRIGLIGLPLCTGPPHPLAPSACSADSCLAATPVRCLLPLRCPPPARCSPRLFCPQPSLLASQPAVVPSSPSPVLCQCGTVAWEVVRALFQPLVLHMHPSAPSPPAAPFSPAALAPASPASCQCGTVAWEVLWALFQHLVSHMHQSAPSPNFAPSALSALAAPSPASPALCLCGIVAWEEVQVLPFLHRASQTHPSAPTAPAAFMPASPASCLCGIVAWEEVQVLVI